MKILSGEEAPEKLPPNRVVVANYGPHGDEVVAFNPLEIASVRGRGENFTVWTTDGNHVTFAIDRERVWEGVRYATIAAFIEQWNAALDATVRR